MRIADLPLDIQEYIRELRSENARMRIRAAETRAENAELKLQVVTQQMDIADLRDGILTEAAR